MVADRGGWPIEGGSDLPFGGGMHDLYDRVGGVTGWGVPHGRSSLRSWPKNSY